jgi:hypothetical protein
LWQPGEFVRTAGYDRTYLLVGHAELVLAMCRIDVVTVCLKEGWIVQCNQARTARTEDRPQLDQANPIPTIPRFDNFAAPQAIEGHTRELHRVAARWQLPQQPLMNTLNRPVDRNGVAFADNLLNLEVPILEGAAKVENIISEYVRPVKGVGEGGIMVDILLGKGFVLPRLAKKVEILGHQRREFIRVAAEIGQQPLDGRPTGLLHLKIRQLAAIEAFAS